MKQPEEPVLAQIGPPPSGLRVRANLERIDVALPPYLRGRAALLVAGAAALVLAYQLSRPGAPGLERWIAQVSLALSALPPLLWARRGLIARLARWCRRNLLVGAGLAASLPVVYGALAPDGFDPVPVVGVVQASMLLALAYLALAWAARRPATAAIDMVKLEIHEGDLRRQGFALEEIRSIQRDPALGRVRINGERVPALSGLPGGEWEWIENLLYAHISRRRAALLRQGHNLHAPPPGLAQLRSARERP